MIVTTATDWTGKPEEVTVSTGESVDWNAGATISAAPVHRKIRKPDFLSKLSASADTAIAHRYALSFSFDGYLRDEREFYAIPEIRTYFENLAAAWPYWAWFINPKANVPFLPLVMMLLTPGEATQCTRGATQSELVRVRTFRQSRPDWLAGDSARCVAPVSCPDALAAGCTA